MPGYFQAMGIPLVRGRDVTIGDNRNSPGVVVINETLARKFFPGEDAIGKRITFGDPGKNPQWLTIIGIAKDARQGDWAEKPYQETYIAALQNRDFLESPGAHMAYLTVVARTSGDPAALTGAMKQAVWSFDRNLPVSEVITMDEAVSTATAEPRFQLLLLALFAGLALLLAAVGIYGVMSYTVARRTHEIGIRMSLGASRGRVLSLVVRQGMTLALAGSAAGIAGALVLSRWMTRLLYGVRATDPLTFLAVPVVLVGIALLATLIPARRATRIDPMIALRYE
jgi:putative ABC transport system permease protein